MGEKKRELLEEAAIKGDTGSLTQILDEDPLILRRVMVGGSVHTPLHVAANWEHLEFVRKLLDNNKALARVLDERRQSALHLAAANGHDKIVEVLVEANANMCFTPDGDGRNPLHLAAVEGHDSVLRVFFEKNPHWIHMLLKAIDGGGNTILHLAVMNKKFQTVKLLLDIIKVEVKTKDIQPRDNPVNVINKCGCTTLDIMKEFKWRYKLDFKVIEKKFREVNALKAEGVNQVEGLNNRHASLMVVASLIATVTFQAGVTPPGGVWQDEVPNNSTNTTHTVGEAVLAYKYPDIYARFIHANTIGLVSSLSIIFFLLTKLTFKKKFAQIMMLITCLTVTSMALAYAFSIYAITPGETFGIVRRSISVGVIVWSGVVCVIVVIHTIPFLSSRCKVIWYIIRLLMEKFMKFISLSSKQRLPNSFNGNEPQPAPAA